MPRATVLLTRPEAASRAFAAALRGAGVTVPILIAPLLAIRPRAAGPGPLDGLEGVIFTSANAVGAFSVATKARPPAWCVGTATTRAARAAGFSAHDAGGDAEALLRTIRDHGACGPFLHARGAHARGDIARRLTALGRETREAVLYDQVALSPGPEAQALLSGEEPVVVPLFSPRTAVLFADAAAVARAPLHLAAMSEAVARALQDAPAPRSVRSTTVADAPDASAMCTATRAALAAAHAG